MCVSATKYDALVTRFLHNCHWGCIADQGYRRGATFEATFFFSFLTKAAVGGSPFATFFFVFDQGYGRGDIEMYQYFHDRI